MSPTQALDSAEIRRRFLEYFEEHGHTIVESAPLVPDDPTLLFVNAGMVPFKDAFLGLEERPYRRATSCQKCMRVSGKHNDLENVGPSPRHHTFFEMLGNFSFGDYFKREAIERAWDFLTVALGIDGERLVATVHRDDDEAHAIWVDEVGLPAERVLRMGDATNFWMMADVGPCGPTSELHYDFGPAACSCGEADCSVLLDNGCTRWLEVWNLVFMQYDQSADGSRVALPQTGVDTGMGLERVVAVLQDASANYDTDLFAPIMDAVQRLAGHDDAQRAAHEIGYRVLADHGRAMTFLIGDGVLPGNDGRSYVLRLIMRRAMRFGRLIGFDEPFLGALVQAVIDTMTPAYPQLAEKAAWIGEVAREEEARFARTLEAGLEILDGVIAEVKAASGTVIPGDEVFRLYDTFGFPPDLTRVVAEEHDLGIDRAGFEAAMDEQRRKARAGAGFGVGDEGERYRRLELPATTFTGYEQLACQAEVLAIVVDGQSVERAGAGDEVQIVLDRTPFYAEAGGQVGDQGELVVEGRSRALARVRVEDTRRPLAGVTVHHGRVAEGTVSVGESVEARVDGARRRDILRNHTATHLLHHALQTVLGSHAQQRGSLVAPERLRFDFAHLKGLDEEELVAIEGAVNRMVRADSPVAWREMAMDEAKRLGATMLFGEKYGDQVRVVEIEGVSRELCGGTHLNRTGQVGAFILTGESSVGSGLRRIEALTGRAAEAEIRGRGARLQRLAETVGAQTPEQLEARVDDLVAQQRELARALDQARAQLAARGAAGLVDDARDVAGVQLVAARVDVADSDALRGQADALRDALGEGVIVLASAIDDKPRLLVAATDAAVARGAHAGKLVKTLAAHIGGGGGGRPALAEAGGRDVTGLDTALEAAPDALAAQLDASA